MTARLESSADVCDALGIAFSDEQLAAITSPLRPGVIIAGAGSGKTTVMAARVVWLVGTGAVRPEQVLGLTFTRKAAAELSQRVRAALIRAAVLRPDGVDDDGEQVILTYDSFAARLVSEHGLWLGYEGDPVMITGASRYRLASRVVSTAAGPFEHLSRLRPASITERVLHLDSDLQSHLATDEQIDEQTRAYVAELGSAPLSRRREPYASVRRAEAAALERLELAALARSFQQLKRQSGMVEFADQMAAAARLAAAVPAVSRALRAQFRIVLLDEYQDTSAAQAGMLHGLFSGVDADDGLGHPVTAVGDPFQAIYGWRGAAASNILTFADHFPGEDGAPASGYALTVNRRSGPAILDVANRLAAPLRLDPLVANDLSGALLTAPEGTAPGTVEAGMFITWPDEVAWVADRIAHAIGAGEVDRWSEIAVLLRRNADIAPVFAALGELDVPAEIVGLGGLLRLPEVADVVSTLRVLDDPTANPDLIRLLTGQRWAIGPADLELLGRRARALSSVQQDQAADGDDSLARALDLAVADVDPSELVSLVEALPDPGPVAYSDAARERFALLAAELAALRRHASEPVLDLVDRVIRALGLEVELAATPSLARQGRSAQLAAFVDAVAAYVDVDQEASLAGLVNYLKAEDEHGTGLDQAVPSEANSVKLLTVHRAKGLEWDLVLLPGMVEKVFPADRVTDNWVSAPQVIPAELRGDAASVPQLTDASDAGFKEYDAALRDQQRRSEDRLAYVAVTRARHTLVASGHHWRADLVKPRYPSDYLRILLDAAEQGGTVFSSVPQPGTINPLVTAIRAVDWPAALPAEVVAARRESAAAVHDAAGRGRALPAGTPAEVAELISGWDDDIDRLLGEARAARPAVVDVPLPPSLSATEIMAARRDPQRFAADLARPMPKPPSPAARFGTRFHEWVVRHFDAATLVDPDDVVDSSDSEVPGDAALRALYEAFAQGRFGSTPPKELEFPFSLLVGGQVVRGRIDAIYGSSPHTPAGFDAIVVDWKTGARDPDPLQLAIYRLAWSELTGIPLSRVAAAFYRVADDDLVLASDLPDRRGLEALLASLGE